MAEILIAYSSVDGHTRKISERLKQSIEQQGHRVTLASVIENPEIDIKRFDKIIVGASVRYGVHGDAIDKFIKRNQATLDAKPNAFFSVNLVARNAPKDQPETNPYLQKFLQRITWKPKTLGVFAGKLDYPSYRFWDRVMIQLIMKMTKGPTDKHAVIDYTNWSKVDEFGRAVSRV